MIEGSVYHIEGRSELEGKETVSVTTISEVAYQKEQEAILKGKAEQADVDKGESPSASENIASLLGRASATDGAGLSVLPL